MLQTAFKQDVKAYKSENKKLAKKRKKKVRCWTTGNIFLHLMGGM